MLLSPFLDDEVVNVAAHAVRRGTTVLAVDVLPATLRADRGTQWGEIVLRVLRAEHLVGLNRLRDHGVAVVGSGEELVGVLRRRAARGRRARGRT